jgi:hypothetical protein
MIGSKEGLLLKVVRMLPENWDNDQKCHSLWALMIDGVPWRWHLQSIRYCEIY